MANTKVQSEQIANDAVVTSHIADNVGLGGSPTTTTQSPSDNSTKIATTAYVDAAYVALVDSSPATLNTLNELAAALGDDANFSTTVTNSIATKLPLAGGTLTGDLILGDNVKLEIGSATGGDLQLYHDGSDSYISDAGTGILKIKGSEIRIQSTSGENMAIFNPDGAVQLQYDNGTKLSTTSTGVSSTGYAISNNTALYDDHSTLSAYSDTNGVYLNGKNAGWLSTSADGTQRTYARFFGQSNSGGEFIQFNVADATRMKIDSSGKIVHSPAAQGSAFDASDNTTWNALEIFQDRGVTNSGSGIAFRSQSGTNPAGIVSVAGNTTGGIEGLAFITVAGNAGAERMRIAADGTTTIGRAITTTYDNDQGYPLHIQAAGGSQTYLSISMPSDNSGDTGLVIGHDATGSRIINRENQPMMFSSSLGETLRIRGDGQVIFKGYGGGDGFDTPYDQDSGYTNHINAGAFGTLGRNAYDSYITGNVYYHKTGGTAGWKIKYPTYGASVITLAQNSGNQGTIKFNVTNQSTTSSGESVTLISKASIDSDGLKFNTDSAAANALDDYEEGAWSPALNGATTSIQDAHYVKIGAFVYLNCYFTFSSLPNDSQVFKISGLPYATQAGATYGGGSISYAHTANVADMTPLTASGDSYIYFHELDGTSATVTRATAYGRFGSAGYILLNMHYMTAF